MVWAVRPCHAPRDVRPVGGRLADVQVISASLHSGDEEIALDPFRSGVARRSRPGCVAVAPGQGGGEPPYARGAGGGFERVAATPFVVGPAGLVRRGGPSAEAAGAGPATGP